MRLSYNRSLEHTMRLRCGMREQIHHVQISFTRLLKNEPNTWAIKSSGDNGTSISNAYFYLHIPFFFFFFACGEAPHRPPCNTSTISKAIKRCSNSRTLERLYQGRLIHQTSPGEAGRCQGNPHKWQLTSRRQEKYQGEPELLCIMDY